MRTHLRRHTRNARFARAAALWSGLRFSASGAASAPVPPPTTTIPAAAAAKPVGRLVFDASKAGLQKVDKAHVEQIIQAATKNSAFYHSEQRKAEQRTVKHKALVEKQLLFRRLPLAEQQKWAAKANAVEAELETSRDFSRCFIHIDLDMFYAAVEEKFDPSLRDRPFAVGSFAMLATSNYVARQFGVRSGMPGFIAKQLCPQLWIQPLHFDLYRAEAAVVRSVAAHYDPCYVTVGLDELTMDVTAYLQQRNACAGVKPMTADDLCAEFRARVQAATGLTCSGGASHTAAFAKLASNVHKPNGQHTVTLQSRQEVLDHVKAMPVRNVPGIGLATEHQLRAIGIETCADFLQHKAELCYLFPPKTFAFYLSAGLGVVRTHVDRAIAERAALAEHPQPSAQQNAPRAVQDGAAPLSTPVPPRPLPQKSAGKSVTVAHGFRTKEAFRTRLRQLARGAHAVLAAQGTGTQYVCLNTVEHDFTEHSRSCMLPRATNSFAALFRAAAALAEPVVARHRDFRLIGVTFNRLQPMAAGGTRGAQPTRPAPHRYPKRRPVIKSAPQKHAQSRPAMPPPAQQRSRQPRRSASRVVAAAVVERSAKALPRKSAKPHKSPRRPATKQSKLAYVRHV